jgi:hypothetical protein
MLLYVPKQRNYLLSKKAVKRIYFRVSRCFEITYTV